MFIIHLGLENDAKTILYLVFVTCITTLVFVSDLKIVTDEPKLN